MNNLQNDWLAHQLHHMRHGDLMQMAAQERLAHEATKDTAKQGNVVRILATIAGGLRRS